MEIPKSCENFKLFENSTLQRKKSTMLLLSEFDGEANKARLTNHSSKRCSQNLQKPVSNPAKRKRLFKSLTDLSREPTMCNNLTKKKRSSSKQQVDPRKPVRTRSAYNFFYQYQRKLLLKFMYETDGDTNNYNGARLIGSEENEDIYKEVANKTNIKEVHTLLRAQMTELFGTLPVARKKRQHRKTHGKIEMEKLTKLVALRWKNASEEVRSFFQIEADKDSARYKIEMRLYESKLAKERNEIPTLLTSKQTTSLCNPQVSPRVVTPTQPISSNPNIASKGPIIWKEKPLRPKTVQVANLDKRNITLTTSNSSTSSVAMISEKTFVIEESEPVLKKGDHEVFSGARTRRAKGSFFGYCACPANAVSLAPLRPRWYKKDLNFNFVASGYFFD